MCDDNDDFTRLDDSTLLSRRAEMRAELDTATLISTLPPKAAKLIAIEILLADPESLADDLLESCLYILREKLRAS